MLLYGPQSGPPDLTLAMQFLMDDLRFEGRKVTWIALKGNSLRLRVEGYELVLAHTDAPLSAQAFHGVLRPGSTAGFCALDAPRGGDAGAEADGGPPLRTTDLARGRVLHALRNHHHALSVLLRPRGLTPAASGADTAADTPAGASIGAGADTVEDALLVLVRECRALIEPVIEAAPPAAVIWQPGSVAFTCEEFLTSRAETLLRPGDHARPLSFGADDDRPRIRPSLTGATGPVAAVNGTGDAAGASLAEALPQVAPDDPVESTPALASGSACVAGQAGPAPALFGRGRTAAAPQSRSERAARRSAGQLFNTGRATARPAALPRLHRQDARLAQAMRAGPAPEAEAAARARQRRLNLARVANCTALVLWFTLLLPPISGWM